MKNGKFEVGDLVVLVDSGDISAQYGSKAMVTCVEVVEGRISVDWLQNTFHRQSNGIYDSNRFVFAGQQFNLKTQPWFIRTETPEQRIAAQEWLFMAGMEWRNTGEKLKVDSLLYALTNVNTSGETKGYIMAIYDNGDIDTHPSAQEIKLTYKTTVTDVVYPTVEVRAR